MSKLVSVIIPVYNAEKYIGACIESLLNQTYKEIEIICVDDGSTDSSGSVCDYYAKKFLSVVVIHQENAGVSAARNKALSVARGEYFFFVDSDDSVPSNAIETLYNKIKSYDADIVVGNAMIEVSEKKHKLCFEISDDRLYHGNEIINNATVSAFSSVWGKFFAKNIIDNVRFIEGKRINEDGFFVFQCLLKCKKIVQINDVVYDYLYHPGSASHSDFSEKYYDILFFRDEKIKLLNEHYPQMKSLANAVYLKHSISFLNQLIKPGTKKYRKEIKAIRKDIARHSKPLDNLTTKEKIKLLLIKYNIVMYAKIMKRGT